ncbi:FtsX [Acrasis kona]|uniref:FtsX n=1 Tax=Acrasis kona TaxID=1008807 RepID=A0AAW2YGY8_9EUKA
MADNEKESVDNRTQNTINTNSNLAKAVRGNLDADLDKKDVNTGEMKIPESLQSGSEPEKK